MKSRYSIIIRHSTVIKGIICMFIMCYTLNLLGLYSMISYIGFAIAFIYILKGRTVPLSIQTLFVIVFFVAYGLTTYDINGENKLPMLTQCFIFYVVGMQFSRYIDQNGEKDLLFRVTLWGCIGFALHAILTTMTSPITFDRRLTDFSDGYLVPATQLIAWCVCFFAIFPWTVFRRKTLKMFEKIIFLTLTVLAIITSFTVSSRTGIVVFVMAVIFLFLWLIRDRKPRIVVILLAAIALGGCAFYFDMFGFKTAIFNSNLADRLVNENTSLFETPRTARWQYLIQHYKEYIWGGYHYSRILGGQMHSILFDLYDECGIIVSILFVFSLIRLIHGIIRLIRKRKDIFPDNIGISLWFIIVSAVLFSEPVWEYGRHMFMGFVFFVIGNIEYQGFFSVSVFKRRIMRIGIEGNK